MARALFLVLSCWCLVGPANASVLVITNRARTSVTFQLATEKGTADPREFKIESGDCLPIPLTEAVHLSHISAGQRQQYRVEPECLYYFHDQRKGQLAFEEIALSLPRRPLTTVPSPAPITPPEIGQTPPIVTIPVKILYDNGEVLKPAAWETQIRRRLSEASRIFKKHCFVEFQIMAVGSWHSGDTAAILNDAFTEFERQVDPAPARLAIGFLGKKVGSPPDGHLGGTKVPLHTHVLVRERANENTERECLEVLVHELGHFLGAAHSPEPNSAMRPNLGDRSARSHRFRIGFDPLNTLAMCLLSEELRSNPSLRFDQLNISTKSGLRRIYIDLDRARPKDPAAAHYLRRLGNGDVLNSRPGG